MPSPIAIFVFNRPAHTQNTLISLSKNPELKDSLVYFFCDGPRNAKDEVSVRATREVVQLFPHDHKHIIESPTNKGLKKSIQDGINYVLGLHPNVIVIEDDLLLSPHFLNYMNTALEKYAATPRVMQVSGHMFPIETDNPLASIFLPFSSSWGWGTWRRAWEYFDEDYLTSKENIKNRLWCFKFDLNGAYPYSRMLSNRLKGKNNSWAIWFYYMVYKNNGLTLYPQTSLVDNTGFDGSGTHCRSEKTISIEFATKPVSIFPPQLEINTKIFNRVRINLIKQRGILRFTLDNIWRLFGTRTQ